MLRIFLSLSLVILLAGCAQTVFVDPSAGTCTAGANTGNGTCTINSVFYQVRSETLTFSATTAGPSATFSVTGSVSGALGSITSGSSQTVNIESIPALQVTLSDGGTPYAISDSFTVTTSPGSELRESNFNLFDLEQVCSNDCDVGTAQLQVDDGLLATPGIGWSADTDSGLRRIGADNYSLVSGSLDALTVEADQDVVLANTTASRALQTGVGNEIESSTVTTTELGYVSGVTSSIQSQIDGKEPTLAKGNLTELTSSVLTITGGTAAVIGAGTSIEVDQADAANDGYLSSTDWNTFNNKVSFDFTASNDNRLLRTDTVGGNQLQESGITVDDSNNLTGVGTISSGAITSTGGSTFGAAAFTGDHFFNANQVELNGGSNARIVADAATGFDSYFMLEENDAGQWSLGRDQSDSGTFKISQNVGPGTNDFLQITTSGALSMGATGQNHTIDGSLVSIATNAAVSLQLDRTAGSATGLQMTNSSGSKWVGANGTALEFRETNNAGQLNLSVSSAGDVSVGAGDLDITRAQSGGNVFLAVENTDAAASSTATLSLNTAGTNTPSVVWDQAGTGTWASGLIGDGDWVLSNGAISSSANHVVRVDDSSSQFQIQNGYDLLMNGSGGQIFADENDSVSAPAYSFSSYSNTGIYNGASADDIGFASNGASVGLWDSSADSWFFGDSADRNDKNFEVYGNIRQSSSVSNASTVNRLSGNAVSSTSGTGSTLTMADVDLTGGSSSDAVGISIRIVTSRAASGQGTEVYDVIANAYHNGSNAVFDTDSVVVVGSSGTNLTDITCAWAGAGDNQQFQCTQSLTNTVISFDIVVVDRGGDNVTLGGIFN
jgi:hypothetical protein